jgi:hypothetical protein
VAPARAINSVRARSASRPLICRASRLYQPSPRSIVKLARRSHLFSPSGATIFAGLSPNFGMYLPKIGGSEPSRGLPPQAEDRGEREKYEWVRRWSMPRRHTARTCDRVGRIRNGRRRHGGRCPRRHNDGRCAVAARNVRDARQRRRAKVAKPIAAIRPCGNATVAARQVVGAARGPCLGVDEAAARGRRARPVSAAIRRCCVAAAGAARARRATDLRRGAARSVVAGGFHGATCVGARRRPHERQACARNRHGEKHPRQLNTHPTPKLTTVGKLLTYGSQPTEIRSGGSPAPRPALIRPTSNDARIPRGLNRPAEASWLPPP